MKIKDILPLVRLHGRTIYDEEKEALFCNWSCTGFTVKFRGDRFRVKVLPLHDQLRGMPNQPEPAPDWPCVAVMADGSEELLNRTLCDKEEEMWLDLWKGEMGEHTVRFIKPSENARGKLGVLEVDVNGEILPMEKDTRKRVEIVGDSITCGFGNEAPNNSFMFKTMEENGWTAYGALAARELDMEFSMICESGIMAARAEKPMWDMHAMEDIYEYTDEMYDKRRNHELTRWDFEKNHNDIVVLNLGTNDSNPIRFYRDFHEIEGMEAWFHKRYKAFVQQVRKANGPDTHIVCSLGSMDYYLYHHIKAVVDELKAEGDANVSAFEFIPINMMFEGYGAAGHPSAKTHARMGKELAEYLRTKVLKEEK